MKHLSKLTVFLLALLLLVPVADVHAQKRKRKKEKTKVVNSYLDVYGGGGYSAFLHNVDGTSVPGGGAGMLGIGYFMKHKSNFNFRAGVEFMYLNSTTALDPMNFSGDYLYTDGKVQNHTMQYFLNFDKYKEQQNRMSVNIPLMFGAQFNQIYFLVGAKAGINVLGNYGLKTNLTTLIKDPVVIGDYENMPTHGLNTYEGLKYKDSFKFGLDVAVSVEAGMCIDEWMPESAKEFGAGKEKRAISYRVGAFMDYGLMNINANSAKGMLLNFPEIEDRGNGEFAVPVQNVTTIQNNSVLAVQDANGKLPSMNSLVVGAKFTMLLQLDKAPKPVKKKPRRRPAVRDVTFIPDPTYFYMFVNDFETDKPLDALVKVYTLDQPSDTIFAGMTDIETGFVEEQIDNGQYGITITRPGYIDYNDTLFRVISDTLYVDLQPIKKNTVVILRNLLFDTDKTVIRNVSTQSLEEMYQLLVKNPGMRIRITGHTDNVGSERYNKKLSEGRAKAVYDEMVKRGIDPSRMEWNGRGSKEPIESNKTPEGRAENRRVEFKILSNE